MEENQLDVEQLIKEQNQASFDAKIKSYQLMGDLSSWRTNFKNNSNRTKMLDGYNKIEAFMARLWNSK